MRWGKKESIVFGVKKKNSNSINNYYKCAFSFAVLIVVIFLPASVNG